jgi:heat shock protein HtpX
MASLASLRASMIVTMVLITMCMLFLLAIIDLIFMYVAKVFCPFFLLVLIAMLFVSIQVLIGPWLVKRSAHIDAQAEQRANANPFLVKTVKELTQMAGVPMPRMAVTLDKDPNAFVFGTVRDDTWLVIHMGLLELLNKEEIEGVLAHEVGHLRHNDCVIMTIASAIPLMMYVLARGGIEALRSGRNLRGKNAGMAILIAFLVGAVSYLVYLLTQLMVLYLSRTREYYADAFSAEATGSPNKLASALVKIMTGLSLETDHEHPRGIRAFYVSDPVKAVAESGIYKERMKEYDLDGNGVIDDNELEIAMRREGTNPWRKANDLFQTHPNIYKRVLLLRKIELEMDTVVVEPLKE